MSHCYTEAKQQFASHRVSSPSLCILCEFELRDTKLRLRFPHFVTHVRTGSDVGRSKPRPSLSAHSFRYSGEEMRGDHTEKFAGRNNFCSFPEARKVAHVSGDEIVCSSSIRALHEEDVVAGICSNPKLTRRGNESSAVLYEL
jgi:hypothetical protein